jgi:hypothetical protein
VRGRVPAGKDDMGGSAASRITNAGSSIVGTTLGAAGGAQSTTLTAGQIPTITSSNGAQFISVNGGGTMPRTSGASDSVSSFPGPSTGSLNSPYNLSGGTWTGVFNLTGTNAIAVSSDNTGGGSHINVQPTIICNYILRII